MDGEELAGSASLSVFMLRGPRGPLSGADSAASHCCVEPSTLYAGPAVVTALPAHGRLGAVTPL